MNYQSIWKGDEYAWSDQRPKGIFPRNGVRVNILDKRKVTYVGNTRQSAEVRITYEYEYTPWNETTPQVRTIDKWVPAREIVDFWDSYSSELEHYRELDRERRERAEADRKARNEERERKLQLEAMEREQRITDFSVHTGIPRDQFKLMPDDENVMVTIAALQQRLGVDW